MALGNLTAGLKLGIKVAKTTGSENLGRNHRSNNAQ
jgi:hypothetical protein